MTDKTDTTATENMALALLPYYTEGDKKSDYLKYIIAGFSKMEAVKMTGIHLKTVHRWEEDPIFMALLEKSRTELRDTLANKLMDIEFTRNFMLVLKKDFNVLFKDATNEPMTDGEQDYLKLIRKFYTPQQYAMVKQMVSSNGDGAGFDFTKTVLEIRLSKETRIGG